MPHNLIKDKLINLIEIIFQDKALITLHKTLNYETLYNFQELDADNFSKLNNWRPLTLLNTDYKIITKNISNRIKKYITKIIKQSQTGFIKGRYIGENIRLIQETIVKLEDENLPGLLLFADFEKCSIVSIMSLCLTA